MIRIHASFKMDWTFAFNPFWLFGQLRIRQEIRVGQGIEKSDQVGFFLVADGKSLGQRMLIGIMCSATCEEIDDRF